MKRLQVAWACASILLAGCATEPALKMVPVPNGVSGVRFAQGDAAMVSACERSAVELIPLTYNHGDGTIGFIIAAYNHSGEPVNFGAENVSIRTEDKAVLGPKDFDSFRQEARAEADRARSVATATYALEAAAAVMASRRSPEHAREFLDGSNRAYADAQFSIQAHLDNAMAKSVTLLRTTTVDPHQAWAGVIVSNRPALEKGAYRRLSVTVLIGSDVHAFSVDVGEEGTPIPRSPNIAAVSRTTMDDMSGTPRTFLWDYDAPAPFGGAQAVVHTPDYPTAVYTRNRF